MHNEKTIDLLIERTDLLSKQVTELQGKVDGEHEVEVFIETDDIDLIPMYAKLGDAGMDLIAAVDAFIPIGKSNIIYFSIF
jgi:hypothetical protein